MGEKVGFNFGFIVLFDDVSIEMIFDIIIKCILDYKINIVV